MSEVSLKSWLWIDELAAETGIPMQTLRHWRLTRSGGPASFLIGRRVAYDRQEVARWVARQESATGRTGRRVAR